MQRLFSRRGRI